MGAVIAPGGELIVATRYNGIFVYDPPFKGKPRWNFPQSFPLGILLFDSKGRLFDVDYGGGVYVFDPPYTSGPALTITGPPEIGSAALDGRDNLFLTGGSAEIYGCPAPKYACKALRYGFPVTVDGADDMLYAGLTKNTLAKFAPPYHKAPIAKVTLPFGPTAARATSAGPVFVAGGEVSSYGRLAILDGSLKGHMKIVSMESYARQNLEFWTAKNRDLFVSDGTYHKPCVAIHPYPYKRATYRCISTKYPIWSVFAQ